MNSWSIGSFQVGHQRPDRIYRPRHADIQDTGVAVDTALGRTFCKFMLLPRALFFREEELLGVQREDR